MDQYISQSTRLPMTNSQPRLLREKMSKMRIHLKWKPRSQWNLTTQILHKFMRPGSQVSTFSSLWNYAKVENCSTTSLIKIISMSKKQLIFCANVSIRWIISTLATLSTGILSPRISCCWTKTILHLSKWSILVFALCSEKKTKSWTKLLDPLSTCQRKSWKALTRCRAICGPWVSWCTPC